MTETSEHTQPLARGEIRRHTVGVQTFQIMHALAGSYVQVAIRTEDEPTHVVCLEMAMDEHKALATYAELIRIAELVAAPERGDSEDEDTAEPLTPEGAEALRVRAGFAVAPVGLGPVPMDRSADGVPEVEQCDDCETTGQNCWAHGGHERSWGRGAPGPVPEGPYGALAAFADDARRVANDPAPTRADDVAALRAEVEAHWRDGQLPNYMATLFDRIAGAVPQPTRVWMHRCGVVLINDTEPPPCHVCVSTPQIPFVRLYSLSEIR